jgi:dienelactone hydrolase
VVRESRDQGTRVRDLSVAHDGVWGRLFTPAASKRRSVGILIFGGSEGGLRTLWEAGFLAAHGYTTLAVGYFDGPGVPAELHDVPIEYFARGLRILDRQPGVDSRKLAVYGISYGGQAAQLLGIHYPNLVRGVVALVTANGSMCGIPPFRAQQELPCLGAAWSFRGRSIPYQHATLVAGTDAEFHDELTDGPIFLACGGQDIYGSCVTERAIVERLRAHHFAHRIVFLQYPKTGHAMADLIPYVPSYDSRADGFGPDGSQRARMDAWPKLLAFLASL